MILAAVTNPSLGVQGSHALRLFSWVVDGKWMVFLVTYISDIDFKSISVSLSG